MKTKDILSNEYLLLLARLALGAVFIFAGMEKISDPEGFARAIYAYRLFPEILINFLAVAVPWIEVVSGLLLVFGTSMRENAAIITSLLLMFIIIVLISIARDLNIECGCFATASGMRVGWLKVLENSGLVILGLYIIFFDNRSFKLE
ncbi:MAG TPA: MauE/DoxX family redox-associated membrane protein [Ignavibacteriales bacterium]|nr:MauE/DoxX family redox-associated membrane protein [Ignavibacteriales bacterium]